MGIRKGITLGLLVVMTVLLFATANVGVSVGAGSSCGNWTSRRVEPNFINVLDVRTGKVHTKRFQAYVAQVMASGEWPTHSLYAKLVAGAMATKQYAWYYVVNWRGGVSRGKCYHVVNTTNDQLWSSGARPTRNQKKAVRSVMGLRVLKHTKHGLRFFLTGYRAGTARKCARDSNDWKLFARSSGHCARIGWSGYKILGAYYTKTAFRCSSKTAVVKKTKLRRGERICKEPRIS